MRERVKIIYHSILKFLDLNGTLPELSYKEIEDSFRPLSAVRLVKK
jgi:hypothetical protein